MITEMIENSPEYRQIQEESGRAGVTTPTRTGTVGDALGPVVDLEKGDVEFWLQIAQLIVLLLILRELRGGW